MTRRERSSTSWMRCSRGPRGPGRTTYGTGEPATGADGLRGYALDRSNKSRDPADGAARSVLLRGQGGGADRCSDRREFSHALLALVVRKSEAELGSALDRLIQAGLLFRQGVPPYVTYLFKHALVQDTAYGTLLREPRRVLHGRIAETLESQFAEIAESLPELLARHWETTKEKWCEAEIHRTAGEIALSSPEPDAAKAEGYFQRALAISREQQAKSWELRAAMSIARLWRDQGKRQQAQDLLAPLYSWFTDGFDTLDLKDAKLLLEQLA